MSLQPTLRHYRQTPEVTPWLCLGRSTLKFMRVFRTPPTITSSLPAICDVGGRRPQESLTRRHEVVAYGW